MKYDKDGNFRIPESDREFVHGAFWTTTKAAVVGFLVVAVIALGVWGFMYATADTRGRVALHNVQRSPQELKFNYEYFHNTCHAILASNEQIKHLQAAIDDEKANPPASDPFGQEASRMAQLRTDLVGAENIRDTNAQEYNAKSHEFTRDFIKSKDLPDEIGPPTGVPYDTLTCERVSS